jgi:hypothetical protein
MQMEPNTMHTTSCRYECSACGFNSVKYSDYARHIATKKHNKRIELAPPSKLVITVTTAADDDDDEQPFPTFTTTSSSSVVSTTTMTTGFAATAASDSYACRICKRAYSARNSAWYHEKKCKQRQQRQESTAVAIATTYDHAESTQLSNSQVAKDEIIDRLLKDNAEMMKIIKDIVPRIGTTMIMNTTNHNKFNVNVFLNEQCKDAVNISDFVNSIRITMQDLHVTEERGLVESISNVLVQGLNDMDVYKRPIHCTDLKRDILYVKDNEQWERDETQEHIRKSVNDIAYKQILSVENWKNGLPNIHCDEKLQLQYNTLLLKTLADTGEKDIRKIVKTVCKQVYLPDAPQIQPA